MIMVDYLQFLRQFSPLSDEAWAAFSKQFRAKTAMKGDILLQEGQIQKELLLVLEGVQMSYYYHNDKQHIMAFTYPPSLWGSRFFSKSDSLQILPASYDRQSFLCFSIPRPTSLF
jgi:signal-transduction protein with cAMP-binding, CBS, and nucleotidyltransferase domain